MNIKDLANYQLVNDNNDNPILVGTPTRYTFTYTDATAYDIDGPSAEEQVNLINDSLSFVQNNIINDIFGEFGDGVGVWWYLEKYDINFVNITGTNDVYLRYNIYLFKVEDINFPSTSPSGL
jgi:hypothetical protein